LFKVLLTVLKPWVEMIMDLSVLMDMLVLMASRHQPP